MAQTIDSLPRQEQAASGATPVGLESSFKFTVDLLGLETFDRMSLAQKVLEGFSFDTFLRLQEAIKLPTEELANLVDISLRTLTRRRDGGQLRASESERILRYSRLFSLAVELFEGDKSGARTWLSSPKKALSGMTPLELARTEVGAREVEALIGRLEHGVFS